MRRQFMGRVVDLLGSGGQSFAEHVLGWNLPFSTIDISDIYQTEEDKKLPD